MLNGVGIASLQQSSFKNPQISCLLPQRFLSFLLQFVVFSKCEFAKVDPVVPLPDITFIFTSLQDVFCYSAPVLQFAEAHIPLQRVGTSIFLQQCYVGEYLG